MTKRERVIEVAREWLGTPFLANNCLKGRGCDCGSFLAGVFAEAGIIEPLALGKYNYLAPCMAGDGFYLDLVRQHAEQVHETAARPGDIVMYQMGRAMSHAGIVVEWPRAIIHADRGRGVTMAAGNGGGLKRRAHVFFRMNGIADV